MKRRIFLSSALVSSLLASPMAAEDVNSIATQFALEKECSEVACVGDAANACMDFDPRRTQTTAGMIFCFYGEAAVWTNQLDLALERALAKAREWDGYDRDLALETAVREDDVRVAQATWLAYREAQCQMVRSRYGRATLGRVAAASCWNKLSAFRVFELESYVQDKG